MNWNLDQACAIIASDDCRGQSLLHVILETLKSPRSASFQQLLSLPKIRQLGSHPETKPFFNLIELFAYKSYQDFKANENLYPPLSPDHIRKLQMLSLLTLAATSRTLSYHSLMAALGIDNGSDLEQLVIDGIYKGHLEAKLDQANRRVRITRVEARDVHSSQKVEMVSRLQSWLERYDDFRDKLDVLAADIDKYSETRIELQKEAVARAENLRKDVAASHESLPVGDRGLPGSQDNDVEMVDAPIRPVSGSGSSFYNT